jgi:flagellar assembly factor FliW
MIRVESEQYGSFEIPEESVVTFPHGIPGFPTLQRYCIIEVKQGSRFKLLQSIDNAGLAFVITDPLGVDPDYPLQAIHEAAAQFGLEQGEPVAVAAIVTVPKPPGRPTANMLAPLVMGKNSRLGVQIVLHDRSYEVRHEL